MDNEFINLGRSYGDEMKIETSPSPAKRIDYPTLYIRHKSGESDLDELPDGEFEFVARGRIKRYTEDYEQDSCSCEIEVIAIKPMTKKAKKSRNVEKDLDSAFEEIASKKNS